VAYLLGEFVGGLVAVYLMAALWEWALFKRVLDDPLKGKLVSASVGWLTSGAIAGWGMADGGPYNWSAFLIYLPAALVISFFAYRRGMALREQTDFDDVAETFS
jgi:hypothetical protein